MVNDPVGALAAFERGDIVAYAGALPDIATLQARGFPLRSIIPTSLRAANGGDTYWALRETMDKNPAAFKAYVAALAEARAYIGRRCAETGGLGRTRSRRYPPRTCPSTSPSPRRFLSCGRQWHARGSSTPLSGSQWWDTLVANKVIDPAIGKPTDFYTNEFQSQIV